MRLTFSFVGLALAIALAGPVLAQDGNGNGDGDGPQPTRLGCPEIVETPETRRLVAEAESIAVLRVTSIERFNRAEPRRACPIRGTDDLRVRFAVEEVLKGDLEADTITHVYLSSLPATDLQTLREEQSGERHPLFWEHQGIDMAPEIYANYVLPGTQLAQGGRYLVLMDENGNPMGPLGYSRQRIREGGDLWEDAIRTLIVNPLPEFGRRLSIPAYLDRMHSLVLVHSPTCSADRFDVSEPIVGEPVEQGRITSEMLRDAPGRCEGSLSYLAAVYPDPVGEGIDPDAEREVRFFPIRGGEVDFTGLDAQITFTGPRRMPISRLIAQLRG